MSTRRARVRVAQQTMAILKRGYYELPTTARISIATSEDSAICRTVHYPPEGFTQVFAWRDCLLRDRKSARDTSIRVTNATTLAAARELTANRADSEVLVLNFASAENPAGGFLKGSGSQEESLERATGIFPCISQVTGYYDANRKSGTCLYTDHMIYSPSVPVFRDDNDQLLAEPYHVAVITAPAVNAGIVRQNEPGRIDDIESTMQRRMEKILSLAAIYGHRAIVLGAWGCGVFQNNPMDVAQWFHGQLNGIFLNVFDTVVFAVLDHTAQQVVITPFKNVFEKKGVVE